MAGHLVFLYLHVVHLTATLVSQGKAQLVWPIGPSTAPHMLLTPAETEDRPYPKCSGHVLPEDLSGTQTLHCSSVPKGNFSVGCCSHEDMMALKSRNPKDQNVAKKKGETEKNPMDNSTYAIWSLPTFVGLVCPSHCHLWCALGKIGPQGCKRRVRH